MHFFPFLFDTRPTSLFLLRRSSMLPPSSGANTWTWTMLHWKSLDDFYTSFIVSSTKEPPPILLFSVSDKRKKKKVILSNRNWTFYSIAFLPILYKSTVLFYLFFCVHSRQKEEDGYLCNVYLGLLLLSCVHQWCLFLMRLLSPSFAVFFPVLYFQVIFVNSGVALWVYYYFVAKNWVGMHV